MPPTKKVNMETTISSGQILLLDFDRELLLGRSIGMEQCTIYIDDQTLVTLARFGSLDDDICMG